MMNAPFPDPSPASVVNGLSVDVDEVFEVPDEFFAARAWPEEIYEVIEDIDLDATTKDEE